MGSYVTIKNSVDIRLTKKSMEGLVNHQIPLTTFQLNSKGDLIYHIANYNFKTNTNQAINAARDYLGEKYFKPSTNFTVTCDEEIVKRRKTHTPYTQIKNEIDIFIKAHYS